MFAAALGQPQSAQDRQGIGCPGFPGQSGVVANLLRELKYRCQANRKTREGSNHPDRDAHSNTSTRR
jgi:hypothetical protein